MYSTKIYEKVFFVESEPDLFAIGLGILSFCTLLKFAGLKKKIIIIDKIKLVKLAISIKSEIYCRRSK